ncbi:MAG: prolyl oligopeptidase family serine peptidase [Halobacteriaceae archaeon]
MGDGSLVPDDIYAYSQLTELSVSPQGDRVAYIVNEYGGDDEQFQSLFIAPTTGDEPPHRLTRVSDASSPQWSPDGSKLAFISEREQDIARQVGINEDSDEETEDIKPQVWVFDLERGGDAYQITNQEEGVVEFDWGPDSNRIVVGARDPTDEQQEYLESLREDDGPIEIERLQHKVEGQGWTDEVKTYLFIVDIESGETKRLDKAYQYGATGPTRGNNLGVSWGSSDQIAFIANYDDPPDESYAAAIYLINPDGSNRRKLTDTTLAIDTLEWGPNADQLAFVGGDPINWYQPREVYVLSVEDRSYTSISNSIDRTVSWFSTPTWIDAETLLCPFADEARSRLVRLHTNADNPERVFTDQGKDRTITLFDYNAGTIAICLSDSTVGFDIYTLSRSDLDTDASTSNPLTRVTSVNEEILEKYDTYSSHRIHFDNSDGIEIEGIAYLPPDFDVDDPDPRPLITNIHGGPMGYDSPGYSFNTHFWTNQGYIVLGVNYRGSVSYGQAFCESLRGSRGELETDDIVSGIEYLCDKGWVDSDRLFVTGFSYGGITTAHIVTKYDIFTAAAAEHGIYDFYSNFGTDDLHNWHEDEFGLPWENIDRYREISSITNVGEINTPLLITAGDEDWRCPPTQAEQLYVSVKKQGIDSKLIIYQNEHHNIGTPDRAIHRLKNLQQWFENYDPGLE